jgi:hypothetical protein
MRKLLLTLSLLFAFAAAQAMVVRPAPDFTFTAAGNKPQSLKSLRGTPVVLVIAHDPKSKELKQQIKQLHSIYLEFANKHVIFVVAYTGESGRVPSDIPFVIANNGPAVAAAYGVAQPAGKRSLLPSWVPMGGGSSDFAIAIIGKDGNLDYQSERVQPAYRVHDVIQNSYEVQANTGRQ